MFWQLLDVSWVSFSELTMVAGFGTNTRSCRSNEHLRLATLLAQAWAWYGYTLSSSIKREREGENNKIVDDMVCLIFAYKLWTTIPFLFVFWVLQSHMRFSRHAVPFSPMLVYSGSKTRKPVFFGYEPRPIKVEESNYWAPRFEIFW